jgi:hypothetical protein
MFPSRRFSLLKITQNLKNKCIDHNGENTFLERDFPTPNFAENVYLGDNFILFIFTD